MLFKKRIWEGIGGLLSFPSTLWQRNPAFMLDNIKTCITILGSSQKEPGAIIKIQVRGFNKNGLGKEISNNIQWIKKIDHIFESQVLDIV